ncbi:hypothetical protein M426DRAFT_19937 [Hypoxylon sp. CI-4A]|nr:hypothetical protein M426DRAFT_19937 [Hypoxylon sp. CI-4A]
MGTQSRKDSACVPSTSLVPNYESFPLDGGGFGAIHDADADLSPDMAFQIDNTFDAIFDMAGNVFSETHDFLRRDIDIESAATSKTLSMQSYSKMSSMCDDYAPWQLADPSTKVAYALKAFKSFHATFAQHSSTMYLHRHVYMSDTPRCILQAFSTSVLYTNQTEAIRGLVLKVLHENATDLVQSARGTSCTPRERLARVHALIIYQSIRMFDGDVTLGQQAENDLPILEDWTSELEKLRDNLEEYTELDAAEIRNKPPDSWERWLFAESVRRTYIIAIALKTFWALLRGYREPPDLGNWQFIHRWTLSRHLWAATNPLDFYKAWKEKPMWIVSATCCDQFLQTGRGDDADDFSLVFLTMSFGVNEMKMFCHETSGRLLE